MTKPPWEPPIRPPVRERSGCALAFIAIAGFVLLLPGACVIFLLGAAIKDNGLEALTGMGGALPFFAAALLISAGGIAMLWKNFFR